MAVGDARKPATGRLDRRPISVQAQTRLEEERLLLERTKETSTTPVVLRLGMVYGRGILMIDAARWLARRRLLRVWREPTWMQLLSTADYLRAVEAAIPQPGVRGIYQVGDERPVTLQHFLDEACRVWGCSPPSRMPLWVIYAAESLCEAFALVAGTRSPLTRDFIRIGRVSHWGDTRRAREQLVPRLLYPTRNRGSQRSDPRAGRSSSARLPMTLPALSARVGLLRSRLTTGSDVSTLWLRHRGDPP